MNIYVGNLSWTMTEQDLADLFTPFGEVVSSKIVTDKFNGNRSKGFGFVEMSDDEAGRTAISQLNESDIMGRKIVVNESQPRPKDGSGVVVDLRREASAAKAAVVDLTVAEAAVAVADSIVIVAAEAAAVAAVDTTVINPVTSKNCKVWQLPDFLFYSLFTSPFQLIFVLYAYNASYCFPCKFTVSILMI